jgi:hypothetical protein
MVILIAEIARLVSKRVVQGLRVDEVRSKKSSNITWSRPSCLELVAPRLVPSTLLYQQLSTLFVHNDIPKRCSIRASLIIQHAFTLETSRLWYGVRKLKLCTILHFRSLHTRFMENSTCILCAILPEPSEIVIHSSCRSRG